MWRILIILSLFPIVTAYLLRWWFSKRVLERMPQRPVKVDALRWNEIFGENWPPPVELDAEHLAFFLREIAMSEWKARDPKTYAAHQRMRRCIIVTPPLSILVAVLAVFATKIMFIGGIAIFAAATGLASLFAMLHLPYELNAISHTLKKLKQARIIVHNEDEQQVAKATLATAWLHLLPPVLGNRL